MKKNLLSILLLFSNAIIFAQISNGGFENWTDLPTFDHPVVAPADFTSSNNEVFFDTGLIPCTEILGSDGSGSAMRIETMEFEGEIVSGYAITGTPPEGEELVFAGGFPFSDINVTGMSFDRRYNINFFSPGFVIVQFLAEGVPVTGGTEDNGTYVFPLLGSQGTWGTSTLNFTDPLTQVPDECIIAFACNDVLNETGIVGNYLEIDNITFLGTDEVMPGGDFNTWAPVPSGMIADDWDSYLTANLGLYEQSTESFEGDFSARLNTLVLFGDTIQASIHQGNLIEEGFFPNQLLEPGSYALDFQYQFEGMNMDSATVIFILSEELDPLPEEIAFVVEHLGPTDGWTQHTIDFSEIAADVNYYGVLFTSGMGFDVLSEPESILWLDAVSILTTDECDFTPTIIEGDISLCPGEDILLTTQEYDTYEWFGREAGSEEFEMISDEATVIGEDAEPGIFEVFVNISLDGCVASSEIITIEVYDVPEPIVTVDGETEIDICDGETVVIEVENADDYASFQWMLIGFDIPFATEATYEATGILDLSSTFTIEVSTAECPDLPVESFGVTVNSHSNPNPEITQDGNTLETEAGMDSYEWYLDGVLIDGATDATLAATEDGEYTVIVSNEWDCEGESDDFTFVFVGIEELENVFVIYPNPIEDVLNIQSSSANIATIEIFDLLGKIVLSEKVSPQELITLDCTTLSNGSYIVKIQWNNSVLKKSFIVNR